MHSELKNQGFCINKEKVQRILQKLGLQVTSFIRKSHKYSSYKGKIDTVASNRMRRRFNTHIPHQKITTSTSEFKYYEIDNKGHMTMYKLYLVPYMNMCNGEILSFGIANCHDNSVMENIFSLLKQEIFYIVVYYSCNESKSEIERYIKYYNEQLISVC